MRLRRGLFLSAQLLLISLAGPALAQATWTVADDGLEATTTSELHRLGVLCTDQHDLAIYYAIPKDRLRSELAELPPVVLMISIDPSPGGSRFASHNASPIDGDDEVRFGFRGPTNTSLARKIARAGRSIALGVAFREHGPDFSQYNPMSFTADGSSAAIKAVIAACGID